MNGVRFRLLFFFCSASYSDILWLLIPQPGTLYCWGSRWQPLSALVFCLPSLVAGSLPLCISLKFAEFFEFVSSLGSGVHPHCGYFGPRRIWVLIHLSPEFSPCFSPSCCLALGRLWRGISARLCWLLYQYCLLWISIVVCFLCLCYEWQQWNVLCWCIPNQGIGCAVDIDNDDKAVIFAVLA